MKTAADVMNRSFFHASPSDAIGVLLQEMAERGLGCVPVLDLEGRPLGVATTGEIERCYDLEELTERLSRPAVCMDQHTPVDVAARALAGQPSCCLMLVDDGGVAVGALSPLELLREVIGFEERPSAMRRHEREPGWDQADMLDIAAAHRAPEAPGIILLSPGLGQAKERVVWAEACSNMRERLDQMLREPQADASLEAILEAFPRSVRFRCLTIRDDAQRVQLAGALCNVGGDAAHARRPCLEAGPSPHASRRRPTAEPAMGAG